MQNPVEQVVVVEIVIIDVLKKEEESSEMIRLRHNQEHLGPRDLLKKQTNFSLNNVFKYNS